MPTSIPPKLVTSRLPLVVGRYVTITEECPYTVPAGKILLVTGLGVNQVSTPGDLLVDPACEIRDGEAVLARLEARLFWRNVTGEAEQDLVAGAVVLGVLEDA